MKLRRARLAPAAILVIAIVVAISGCMMPHSSGLMNTFGENGIDGTMTMDLAELPPALTLIGSYEVLDGSLTVTVREPAGTVVYNATWMAGENGVIQEALTPAIGTWTLEVSSPGGLGSYDVRLTY